MTITLHLSASEWISALQNDLEVFRPFLEKESEYSEWDFFEELLREKRKIAHNLREYAQLKGNLRMMLNDLTFLSDPTDPKVSHLPFIRSAEDFLLAVIYRNHLKRFKNTKGSNFLAIYDFDHDAKAARNNLKMLEDSMKTYFELHAKEILTRQLKKPLTKASIDEKIDCLLSKDIKEKLKQQNRLNHPEVMQRFHLTLVEKQRLEQELLAFEALIQQLGKEKIPKALEIASQKIISSFNSLKEEFRLTVQKIQKSFSCCETREEVFFVQVQTDTFFNKIEEQIVKMKTEMQILIYRCRNEPLCTDKN